MLRPIDHPHSWAGDLPQPHEQQLGPQADLLIQEPARNTIPRAHAGDIWEATQPEIADGIAIHAA